MIAFWVAREAESSSFTFSRRCWWTKAVSVREGDAPKVKDETLGGDVSTAKIDGLCAADWTVEESETSADVDGVTDSELEEARAARAKARLISPGLPGSPITTTTPLSDAVTASAVAAPAASPWA